MEAAVVVAMVMAVAAKAQVAAAEVAAIEEVETETEMGPGSYIRRPHPVSSIRFQTPVA